MGYYVNTTGCDFTIARENYDEAYRLLCELNAHDELKRGLCYPANQVRPESSTSVARNPNVWFSWMPWNYDEIFDSAVDILKEVGFTVDEDASGIDFISYDNKTGCEEAFLRALAPVVEPGSYIEWEGEEYGDLYRYDFDGEKMSIRRGTVVWELPSPRE